MTLSPETMITSDTNTVLHSNEATSNRRISRPRVSRRAAVALMTIAVTSSVDTIHAFSESFPQHMMTHVSSHVNNHYIATPIHAPKALTFLSNCLNNNGITEGKRAASEPTSTSLFYAPNPHTTKTAPMVAQAFYSSYKTNRNPTKPRNASSSSMPLSNSVLMSSDTLPAFPTAHGLLSPETVIRMELTTSRGRDQAVDFFLETYRKEGPMACLPLLSDQEVLPRLTQAMRDILA